MQRGSMGDRGNTGAYQRAAGPIAAPQRADFGPKKTMMIAVIVVACFAVLVPKVFYPMVVGNANDYIKPSPIDKATGCCDMFSERDVNTIRVMAELCRTILPPEQDFDSFDTVKVTKPANQLVADAAILQRCRHEIFATCGIDLTAVQDGGGRPPLPMRLDHASVRQVLNDVRSLNGSLCLKYHFGVSPGRLNVPHRILLGVKDAHIRQERPQLLRPELMHPAFRERGAAITRTQLPPNIPATLAPGGAPPRIIEGRPGPIPGMRPPMGGAGGVVPPPKGSNSMSFIMPVYTVAIVIFFTYNLLKIIFRKQPQGNGGVLYPPVDPDHGFRRDVFGGTPPSQSYLCGQRQNREQQSSKLVVNAMSQLLDEVDEEIESRKKAKKANGTVHAQQQMDSDETPIKTNGSISNGTVGKSKTDVTEDTEQTSVKVLGMETTASCEGGQKWSRPSTPVMPPSPSPLLNMPKEPPLEIYLEGCLPAQSKLLVADSKVETSSLESEKDSAVVLSGKMTLSVISLDPPQEDSDEADDEEENEPLEESKYTTASALTAAELETSDNENLTDEENAEELLEDYVNDKENEE